MGVKEWLKRRRNEVPQQAGRFSEKARKALEEKGFIILELTGQSIKTLRDAGNKISSTWYKDYHEFEGHTSSLSQVAILPELFLRDSNNKTFAEQEKLVAEFSKNLNIRGVKAIIGDTADYVELAFSDPEKTGGPLFGEKFGYNYTRIRNKTTGNNDAYVGRLDPEDGLHVINGDRDARHEFLFVAPILVAA